MFSMNLPQVRLRLRNLAALALVAGLLPVNASADEPASVVTTIQPVHALVAGVTAGVSEPYQLVRGGQSPHAFALATSDARALHGADVVFAAGDTVEGFLERAVRSLPDTTQVVWMAAIDGMILHAARAGGAWQGHDHDDGHGDGNGHGEAHGEDHGHGDDHGHDHDDDHAGNPDHSDGHGHSGIDTHIWLDPRNAIRLTEHAADVLAHIDPANAERYRSNADAQIERLQELDAELDGMLHAARERPYLVFHDAYQYFERRYDLAAAGSVTVEPDRAPGARRINELGQRIEQDNIVCIFAEPQFEPRVIHVVSEGTAARTAELDPLGAHIDPGPEAYFNLLRNMARDLEDCLAG